MPDPVTGLIGAGGTIVGGLLGGDASKDAAQASSNASIAGVNENRRQFDTVLNLQAPAINTGNQARSLLASIMGLEVPGSTYSPGAMSAGQPQAAPQGWTHPLRRRSPPAAQAPTAPANDPLTFTTPASSPMSAEDIQSRLESFPGYQFAVQQATKAAQAMGSATGSLGGNVVSALADRVGGGIAMPTFQNYLNQLQSLSGGAQTATNVASQGALQTGGLVAQGLQNAGDARASGIMGQAGSQIGTIGGILGGIGQAMGNRAPAGNPMAVPSAAGLPWLFGNPI